MDLLIDLIRNTAKSTAEAFIEVAKAENIKKWTFILRANEIKKEDWLTKQNILNSKESGPLLNELKAFRAKPVLYLLEIENEIKHEVLVKAIRDYDRSRAFPAISEHRINNEGHKVLYVGKVKRDFFGRIIQHMGYFSTERTQGLQLAHWACAIGLDVRVTYFVFNEKLADFMTSLEYQVAQNLQPLLGKHK